MAFEVASVKASKSFNPLPTPWITGTHSLKEAASRRSFRCGSTFNLRISFRRTSGGAMTIDGLRWWNCRGG